MSDAIKIELVTDDGRLYKFKTYEGLDLFSIFSSKNSPIFYKWEMNC